MASSAPGVSGGDSDGVSILIRIEGQVWRVKVSGDGNTPSPLGNSCLAEVPACVRERDEHQPGSGEDGSAGKAKQAGSVALYLELLRDECPLVRRFAARALAQMGAQAQDAAAAVHDTARDGKGPGARAPAEDAPAEVVRLDAVGECSASDFFG